jgi:hypothetical protein
MATQSFQAVRRLNDAGAPLPLILANPAWQTLMDKIDSNITERQTSLESALSKLPAEKRTFIDTEISGDSSESSLKRVRVDSGSDLASRKQALLAKISKIEGPQTGSDDDYEAYRRQCWVQYYEWMEKQKRGAEDSGKSEAGKEGVGAPSEADEDEEIHNALLGLS